MNLVLLQPEECAHPLPLRDPRAQHVIEVLRCGCGDSFDCGRVNGPRGKATIVRMDGAGLHLDITWQASPPPRLAPLTLLLGLPRPQTVRKIVSEATTLGVGRLVFFPAERGEPSYGQSSLWHSGEIERLLLAAVAQAFCTRMPALDRVESLAHALEATANHPTRLALDNYEATEPLGSCPLAGAPIALALGPERGWSGSERALLRQGGCQLVHLGARVLRMETACCAGVSILKTRMALW